MSDNKGSGVELERVALAVAAEIDAIDAELQNTSALATPCRDEFRRVTSERIARAAIAALTDKGSAGPLVDRIGHLLADDPICGGRVAGDTVEAIAALMSAPVNGAVEALTPSAETKAAYIGEFSFVVTLNEGSADEESLRVAVPWTTIKEIMATIRERANLSSQGRV